MPDGRSKRIPEPPRRSRRWTSFVGLPGKGRAIRGLQEEDHPEHRLRMVHNQQTLLIHLSDEQGDGWTTMAIDRATREWAVAQRDSQIASAEVAYGLLYFPRTSRRNR